jgi:hypothetical protein
MSGATESAATVETSDLELGLGLERIHVGKRIARNRNQIGKGPGRGHANSNSAPAKACRFIAVPCANRG